MTCMPAKPSKDSHVEAVRSISSSREASSSHATPTICVALFRCLPNGEPRGQRCNTLSQESHAEAQVINWSREASSSQATPTTCVSSLQLRPGFLGSLSQSISEAWCRQCPFLLTRAGMSSALQPKDSQPEAVRSINWSRNTHRRMPLAQRAH